MTVRPPQEIIEKVLTQLEPEILRGLGKMNEDSVWRFNELLLRDGLVAEGRVLRVGVLAAATWGKPEGARRQAGVEIGHATGKHVRGDARVAAAWRVLQEVEDDDASLNALAILAARMRTYASACLTVSELWDLTDPEPSEAGRRAMLRTLSAAYDQAERQRSA